MVRITKYNVQLVKEDTSLYESRNTTSPSEAVKIFNDIFNLENQCEEIMCMICLDSKTKVIGAFEISRGSLTASFVHPREVFKRAIVNNAHSIICAHNHPSGNTTPSKEDYGVTKRLKEAGEIIGIPLLDHIIIGQGFYSFKENKEI